MTPEEIKLLGELSRTQYGRALQSFLREELSKLDTVKTCTSWDETLGRKYAVSVIEKLFNFMEEREVVDKKKVSYT